eukprot:m.44278 g.44278  ORF g.44278 m.44278 type:complete len:174 (-) comp14536_c0_seq1:106-627(-)
MANADDLEKKLLDLEQEIQNKKALASLLPRVQDLLREVRAAAAAGNLDAVRVKVEKLEKEKKRLLWKSYANTAFKVACIGGASVVVAGAALPLAGFTAGGIAAGSAAAAVQSSIGNVVAGSAFAVLQSFAATGGAATVMTAGGATMAAGAAGAAATRQRATPDDKKEGPSPKK